MGAEVGGAVFKPSGAGGFGCQRGIQMRRGPVFVLRFGDHSSPVLLFPANRQTPGEIADFEPNNAWLKDWICLSLDPLILPHLLRKSDRDPYSLFSVGEVLRFVLFSQMEHWRRLKLVPVLRFRGKGGGVFLQCPMAGILFGMIRQ